MLFKSIQTEFPQLWKALEYMFYDNDALGVFNEIDFEVTIDEKKLQLTESLFEEMHDDDLELMAAGDENERFEKFGHMDTYQVANEVLEDFFDGKNSLFQN